MPHALIVDDDPLIHSTLERAFRRRGWTSESASSGERGLAAARARRPSLIMLDIHMEGMSGIETLRHLTRDVPGVPVVIMTGEGSIELAIVAFKAGAVDFVTKPFPENDKLFAAIDAILALQRAPEASGPPIIGKSLALREALELARRFARPDINILLEGETGTGKELLARTIHATSKRRAGPFVALDCANLSATLIESELFGHEKDAFTGANAKRIGRFEQANGGTLFLDEVGNISLEAQNKLLRVLQQRTLQRVGGNETIPLDIRLVAASNANLRKKVDEGTFKLDLFFRIADATIRAPPLRDRDGDLELLVPHFVAKYALEFGVSVRGMSEEALDRLRAHSFVGNVRELEGIVKSALINADGAEQIGIEHLGGAFRDKGAACLPTAMGGKVRFVVEIERDEAELDLKAIGNLASDKAQLMVIEHVLSRGHLTLVEAARILRVDVKTLREKKEKYNLK